VKKMAQQASMTLTEFMKKFAAEEACEEYLYHIRWPEGFICPKCGIKDAPYQIISRHQYQCRYCNHQASVTAGTIMDKTRTPLSKWFLAIYLISTDKRGCSALRLKRELGIAYDTAWTMTHKIRNAMGRRDGLYLLQGIVEMDDSFFGSPSEGGKRGRGTDKTPVVIGLSLDEQGRPGYVKAQVIASVDGDSLLKFAESAIHQGSTIRSDGYSPYNKLKENGYRLEAECFDSKEKPEHLKWLHIVVSNMKAFLLGTYHGVGGGHLQAFLDEFCYRFNRRSWQDQLFPRTLAACMGTPPCTRKAFVMA
jgi:transposase-like protein